MIVERRSCTNDDDVDDNEGSRIMSEEGSSPIFIEYESSQLTESGQTFDRD